MKIVNFPVTEKKDINDLCSQIKSLMHSQPYELSIAEVIGVLEIVKIELLDEAYE